MRCPLKGIINVKLAKALLAMECNVEHSIEGDAIYHGTESLVKINTQLLVKAFSNKQSFIPSNRAIGILFDAKNLFVTHYVLPQARGNKRPRSVPDESIILILHDLNPIRILESSGDSVRFRDK